MATWIEKFVDWNPFGGGKRSLSSAASGDPTGMKGPRPWEDLLKEWGLYTLSANATPETAMGISTFFGCVKLISNVLATMPYSVHKKLQGGGSESGEDHPLHYLIHTRFCENQSSFIGRRTLIGNCLVWGWAIAEVKRDFRRQTEQIIPYASKDWSILHDDDSGRYFFSNKRTGRILSQDDVIFIRDFSFDGNVGVSIVNWQRQVLKIDLLAKKFIQKFYEDGTFMAGFFSTPLGHTLKDEEIAKEFKKRINDSFAGKDGGAFAYAVLGAGVEWHKIGQTPVEADLMPIFEKSDADIAKMFGVPLSMIGDSQKSTSFGTGIEQQYIGVTNNVFSPIAVQLEQEIDYKCFRRDEIKAGYYTRHNFKSLLKGDLKTQAEYNQKMVIAGIETPDEVRALDEKPPHKGGAGSKPYMQGAMMPMELLGQKVKGNSDGNGKKDTSPVTE